MPVYMIQAGGDRGPVKIGFGDPQERLSNLQVAHYERLHIIRLFEGDAPEESALHCLFEDLWIRGEWHNFSRKMLGDVGLVELPIPGKPEPIKYPLTYGQETLLVEVNEFLRATRMSATRLGIDAINDGKFVGRLRSGLNMQTATIERVRLFIEARTPISQSAA